MIALVFTQSIGTDGPKILHISEISTKRIDFAVSYRIYAHLISCDTVLLNELQCTEIIAESKFVRSKPSNTYTVLDDIIRYRYNR